MAAVGSVLADDPAASPVEWWQRCAQRRARWSAGHPAAAQRLRLARTVLAWLGGMAGLGLGAPTFVAGIGEEALKVVPVVVLAVVAPRRVSRFAAVDFVLLDSISRWWNSLSPGQQIAIGLGIALLVAVSGGSLTLVLGVSGVLTWGLDQSAGIATFVRDPGQATRSCFADATPGQLVADPLGVALTTRPAGYGSPEEIAFQRSVAEPDEFKLVTPDETKVWADGVTCRPDTGVTAVEAKYADRPGRSLYEGGAPQPVADKMLGGKKGFDDELLRYAKAVADPANPVGRLDVVVSTDAAKNFLGPRVESLLSGQGLSVPFTIRVGP